MVSLNFVLLSSKYLNQNISPYSDYENDLFFIFRLLLNTKYYNYTISTTIHKITIMLLFMVAIYLYFTIFFRDTLLKCQVLYLLPLKKNSIKTLFVFFLKGNKRLVSECLWVFTLQRNIFFLYLSWSYCQYMVTTLQCVY